MGKYVLFTIVAALLAAIAFTTTLYAETKYVKQGGSGSGMSWADASGDLQDMIDSAYAGDSIFVAEGIYIPERTPASYLVQNARSHTFYLKQGVAIFGGFPSTGNPSISDRDWSVHITILSGDAGVTADRSDNLYHVLALDGVPDYTYPTILDGFIVENGNADNPLPPDFSNGGGIIITQTQPALMVLPFQMKNMIFRNNESNEKGGAVFAAGSNILIENSVFQSNKSEEGGAIHLDNDIYFNIVNIDNCRFLNDSATLRGGAIYAILNQLTCTNTSFEQNFAFMEGGAVYSNPVSGSGSFFNFDNCSFENNVTTYYGGALYSSSSSGATTGANIIKNCSFRCNTSEQDGGALYCYNVSNDSIIYSDFTENYSGASGGAAYFRSDVPENHHSYLEGCSFMKNIAQSSAGAIHNNGYILSGYRCNIDSNFTSVGVGGGIENAYDASLSLNYCRIRGNEGTIGGGIYNTISSVNLFSVDLTGNNAKNGTGGAVENYMGTLNATDVVFKSNYATNCGGGLSNENNSTATLKNCDFLLNSSVYGGGIATRTNSKIVYYTGTVRGNIARIESQPGVGGGGIYSWNLSWTESSVNSATIVNVSITENLVERTGEGGGIYTENSKLKLVNATVAGNSTENGLCGGLKNGTGFGDPDTIDIYNTVILDNYAKDVNNVSGSDILDVFNIPLPGTNLKHNIRYSVIGSFTGTANGNINWTTAQPNFVSPVPDAVYRPELSADYRIRRNSTIINKGQNDTFYNAVSEIGMTSVIYEDAAESPRFIDSIIDIGAYENLYLKPSNKIIYVDINVAPGSKCTGESWRHAVPKLSDALAGIADNRALGLWSGVDTVWVAKGTYYPKYDASTGKFIQRSSRGNSFVIPDSIQIYGGFAPDILQPEAADEISDANPDLNITFLSGNIGDPKDSTDNASHIVIAAGINQSSLSGFYIDGGYAKDGDLINVNGKQINPQKGGGIYVNSDFDMKTLRFTNNYAQTSGGGFHSADGNYTIRDFRFENNAAGNNGGAFNADGGAGRITKNTFVRNNAEKGGAISTDNNASLSILNSRIIANTAVEGGGIYVNSTGTVSVANTLISDNQSSVNGCGITVNNGTLYCTNITVSGNSFNGSNGIGSGIYISGGAHHIRNTVVWGNSDDLSPQATPTGAQYDHSIVQNLALTGTNLDGTLSANDPLFVDNNYHISPLSPILNRGLNSRFDEGQIPDLSKDTFDLDGRNRIAGGTVDMGAYEYDATITLTVGDKTVVADGSPQYIDSTLLEIDNIPISGTDTLIEYYYYVDGVLLPHLPVCPDTYTVVAVYPGGKYSSCSDTAILIIELNNTPQTITFDAIPVKYLNIDPDFNLTATSSNSMSVKFTVTGGNTGCIVLSPDGYVAMLDTGTVYITAYQDDSCICVTPDAVTQVLVITKLNQEITFDTVLEKSIMLVNGVNINPPVFSLAAVASSGLNITYSITGGNSSIITLTPNGDVTLLDTGVVFIQASQSGDGVYYPATPVVCRLHISPVNAMLDSITTYNGKIPFDGRDSVIYYLVPCDYVLPDIEFSFYPSSNAIVYPSGFSPLTVDISIPGKQIFYFELYVARENISVRYTLIVEKRFMFDDLVVTKWNNTFIANNKRAREEFNLYPITQYRWYKNGNIISELSYYSAGNSRSDVLDQNAEYYLIVNTQDGREVRTCPYIPPGVPVYPSSAYPNPVAGGETVTVESSVFETDPENAVIDVYSLQGTLIGTQRAASKRTSVRMPSQKGLYIIQISNGNKKEQISVIVR
ncbi:MAG: T9SS type A sorting domain-containing protein [Bacteroidales bacterium]|nr:T9SS type A sorting domain-containing protein [Bacteroidales bacterium]